MKENIETEKMIDKNESKNDSESKYSKYFNIDINYKLFSKIIKDVQLISQLIKCVNNSQISDVIFIKGNNSYSVDSRFYLNYRRFADFYVKVMDFTEDDMSTQIKYFIYKTAPISKNFKFNISLYNSNDISSKLYIEIIIFNNVALSQKIVDIIFNELNVNINYLLEAIRSNKQQFLYFNSSIVNSDFFPLTQIIKNRKLIDYIINGTFERIKKEIDYNTGSSFINVKEEYKIILKKKKLISDYININNVKVHINLIKSKEDKLVVQFKIISDKSKNNNENDNINNIITIYIRRLTSTSSFILIKYIWNVHMKEDLIVSIKKFINKILIRIEKLCKITKQ